MIDGADILLDIEDRRVRAISEGNLRDLKLLLADDYIHVHMTGKLDDRDGHLQAVASLPRRAVISETAVRIYDDLAVITGHLDNHVSQPSPRVLHAVCHRVLARRGDQWRYISVQLTPRAI